MAQRQHEEMVAQGVKAMLATILTDIQAPGEERQLQGLKALQGLARNAAMFLPLQAAFREAGGFPLLVKLLDAAMPPLPRRRPALRPPVDGQADASDAAAAVATGAAADHADSNHTGGGSGSDGSGGSGRRDGEADEQDVGGGKQEAAAWDADFGAQRISPAVEALTMLARNNPKNRAAAIQAGAVPALCSILQAGAARAVPIALDDVLKALYALAAADASGNSASELFASGGIHSLVQLLGAVVEEPQNAKCRVWARELVELLYPLAARSRIVAALLLQELPVFVRLLTTLVDPLTLSLGLDVLEELLAALGSRARAAIVAEGGLAPLVRLLHMGGLGGKAALLLAALVGGPAAAPAATLRALLQPPDLAALVHIALLASHAQDLDAEPCRQLLEVLVSGSELGIVRGLLLARDCGPCLSMPGVADRLAERLASEEGLLLLASIGARHPVEAALAAAELLPHRPQAAARALLRGGRVGTLVAAALAEAAGEPTAGALEDGNSPPLSDGADCIRALADASAYLRGRDGGTPPATVGPPEADAAAHRGYHENGTHDGDVTFVVSGREVRTARAAIAAASSVVAAALSRVEVGSDTKVVVPPIPGMDPSRLPDTFELLLACLSGPPPSLKPHQVVDLWRLASALQTAGPKAAAEAALPAALADDSSTLAAALAAAAAAGPSGERVAEAALLHLAANLIELHADGSLAALAADFPDMLHSGMAAIMSDRLQPQAPGPPSRAASSSDLSRSFSRRSASGFLPARSGSFSNELGTAASAVSSFLPARSASLASEAGFGGGAASNSLPQRSASLASEAGFGAASFSSRDVFPGSGAGGSLAGGSFLSGSVAGGSAAGSQPVTPSGASSVSVSPLAADRRLGPFGQPPLPPLPETAAATDAMQQSAGAVAAAATAGGSPASSAQEHSLPTLAQQPEAGSPAHPAVDTGGGPVAGGSPPPSQSPSSEDALNRLSQALRF